MGCKDLYYVKATDTIRPLEPSTLKQALKEVESNLEEAYVAYGLDLGKLNELSQAIESIPDRVGGDTVMPEDHNSVREAILKALDAYKYLQEQTGLTFPIDEWSGEIDLIRIVKMGDIIKPDDHNSMVDVIKKYCETKIAIPPYGSLSRQIYSHKGLDGCLAESSIEFGVMIAPRVVLAGHTNEMKHYNNAYYYVDYASGETEIYVSHPERCITDDTLHNEKVSILKLSDYLTPILGKAYYIDYDSYYGTTHQDLVVESDRIYDLLVGVRKSDDLVFLCPIVATFDKNFNQIGDAYMMHYEHLPPYLEGCYPDYAKLYVFNGSYLITQTRAGGRLGSAFHLTPPSTATYYGYVNEVGDYMQFKNGILASNGKVYATYTFSSGHHNVKDGLASISSDGGSVEIWDFPSWTKYPVLIEDWKGNLYVIYDIPPKILKIGYDFNFIKGVYVDWYKVAFAPMGSVVAEDRLYVMLRYYDTDRVNLFGLLILDEDLYVENFYVVDLSPVFGSSWIIEDDPYTPIKLIPVYRDGEFKGLAFFTKYQIVYLGWPFDVLDCVKAYPIYSRIRPHSISITTKTPTIESYPATVELATLTTVSPTTPTYSVLCGCT
ncbi:MAG: hypothetical protein DRP01_11410 [Archaeoglobales archaeon]|nr:MAG: hypothetical protein DRP01_11410 [Archaeoglobales archaeon]